MNEIYPVQKEDYNKLAIFLSNFENATKNETLEFWYSRFALWWDKNPAFNAELLRGFILDCDGRIVGFIGLIPSLFQLSGEQTIVFSSTTWRINRKFRGILSLKLLFMLIDYVEESIYFNTSSSGRIAKMHKRLRLKNIFPEERLKTYYVFINPWNILCEKLHKFLFLKIALALFYPVIGLYHLMIKLVIKMSREFYETRIVRKADGIFDELWESTRMKFQNTNVRTSEVINWYCSNNGMDKNILFGCYLNGKLLGYALCISQGGNKRAKILTVADVWCQIDDNPVVFSLLKKCLKYGVENNFDLVLLPVFSEKIRSFSRKFILNKPSAGSYFLKAKPEILDKIEEGPSYFTYFQGDWGLF